MGEKARGTLPVLSMPPCLSRTLMSETQHCKEFIELKPTTAPAVLLDMCDTVLEFKIMFEVMSESSVIFSLLIP